MPRDGKRAVYLAGERTLVEEFGAVCLAGGWRVVCEPPTRGSGRMPAGFRTAASPPRGIEAAFELTNCDRAVKRRRVAGLDARVAAGTPILSSAVTVSAGEQASWVRRPSRLAGFGAFPTLMGGTAFELSVSLRTGRETLDAARTFFGSIGRTVSVVQDRVGLVMPRILAMLINEACFALTEGVASPQDIDTAMKLGTNYPKGPVEWAHEIGVGQIVAVLSALREVSGEERYRLAPVLHQLALEPGAWKS